ncbi:MarR family winged helix-turn-helix transcriptional regulator [Actinomyces minihominis]|uniref:MarR family winged helix-turn-helix transcriptional regulator n=1 Tax=Actinomyces minihominis TaxID=2002838 RepID=UPI000C0871DE|nr:MarR family transcriptional regulator [Actinomyces minihominis]
MPKDQVALQTWLYLSRFVHRSNCISNAYLTRFDLTVAQFEALTHIEVAQPVTQTDLAGRLTLSGGGVSRMLTRLEEDGLIARTQQWKTKYISLTDLGMQKLREVYPKQVALQVSMFEDVLNESELQQLETLMAKLHTNILDRCAPTEGIASTTNEPCLTTEMS